MLTKLFDLISGKNEEYKPNELDKLKKSPITLEQGFLLFLVYLWTNHKPDSKILPQKINAFIVISLYIIHHNSFVFESNFDLKKFGRIIYGEYVDDLYKQKVSENLLNRNEHWELSLTSTGNLIVQNISTGKCSFDDIYDDSVKEVFTTTLIRTLKKCAKNYLILPEDALLTLANYLQTQVRYATT